MLICIITRRVLSGGDLGPHFVYPVLSRGKGFLMRTLGMNEIELVSGGLDIHIGTDWVGIDTDGGDLITAYDWAVEQMTDFFEWWDPAGYYSRS